MINEAFHWAFGLRNIPAVSKLLAIHLASVIGMGPSVRIDARQAAEFCGYQMENRRRRRPIDPVKVIQIALQSIPDISFEQTGDGEFTVFNFNGAQK